MKAEVTTNVDHSMIAKRYTIALRINGKVRNVLYYVVLRQKLFLYYYVLCSAMWRLSFLAVAAPTGMAWSEPTKKLQAESFHT